jgi:hypothetical protein
VTAGGTLLQQQELAALEIAAGLRELDRDLQRERQRSIQILVQAVEVARAVAEQERRGTRLTRGVATAQEARERSLEARARAEPALPCVRDARERRVERRAQVFYRGGERAREIAVLAAPEAEALHRDGAAEARVVRVESRELGARLRLEQTGDARVAVRVELRVHALPVDPGDAIAHRVLLLLCVVHHESSCARRRFCPRLTF